MPDLPERLRVLSRRADALEDTAAEIEALAGELPARVSGFDVAAELRRWARVLQDIAAHLRAMAGQIRA